MCRFLYALGTLRCCTGSRRESSPDSVARYPVSAKETGFRNADDGFPVKRARSGHALAAHDDPMDSPQVQFSQVFQQGLDGEEGHRGFSLSERFDSRQTMLSVLNTHPPPDMGRLCGLLQPALQEGRHPVCACGQHLVRVPGRCVHHLADSLNGLIRNPLMKPIAHRVHEDTPGAGPAERTGSLSFSGTSRRSNPDSNGCPGTPRNRSANVSA